MSELSPLCVYSLSCEEKRLSEQSFPCSSQFYADYLHLLRPIPAWFLCLSLPCSELQKTSLFRLRLSNSHPLGLQIWTRASNGRKSEGGGRRYQAIYFPTPDLCPLSLSCFAIVLTGAAYRSWLLWVIPFPLLQLSFRPS